jgi:hypothetical protein
MHKRIGHAYEEYGRGPSVRHEIVILSAQLSDIDAGERAAVARAVKVVLHGIGASSKANEGHLDPRS